jgi:hypothetical protein
VLRTCKHCLRALEPSAFARNKHHPDGSGRSSYCVECCVDPELWHLAENERKLDWLYRDPVKRKLRDLNLRLADKHKRERAERTAARAAMEKPYIGEHKVCIECGLDKPLTDFPHNHYARPRSVAMEHSGRCWECWRKMPDYRRELARERARDYSAARTAAPDYLPLGAKRRQKVWRDELHNEALKLGIEPSVFKAMTPDERTDIRFALLGE